MSQRFFALVSLILLSAVLLCSCAELVPGDVETALTEPSTEPTVPSVTDQTTDPNPTEPVDEQLPVYTAALKALEQKEYQTAYDLFLTIKGYRDVDDHLSCFSYQYALWEVHGNNVGEVNYYEYDEYGRIIKRGRYGSSCSDWVETRNYDDAGHVIEVKHTDQYGSSIWTYEYNEQGQVIRHISPSGIVYDYEYDAEGRKIKTTESYAGWSNDSVETWEYSETDQGTVVTYTETLSNGSYYTIVLEYNEKDQCVRRTSIWKNDPANIIEWSYDDEGRVILERNVTGGSQIEYEYDARGNKIRETRKATNGSVVYEIQWAYDSEGYMLYEISTERTYGYSYHYEYDDAGNRIKSTYKNTHGAEDVRLYEYDSHGNLIRESYQGHTDAEGDRVYASYYGYQLYYNPFGEEEIFYGK